MSNSENGRTKIDQEVDFNHQKVFKRVSLILKTKSFTFFEAESDKTEETLVLKKMTIDFLHDGCLANIWWLSGDCLATVWQPSGNRQATVWQLSGD